MARQRTRVRLSRSLRAVAVALLAAVTATALFEAEIGRALLLSSSTVAGAPPVLYLVLAMVLLRGAPLSRRLGWAIAACGVYAALGLVSGVTLSLAHPMSLEGAMRRSLWSFAPAPLVHLLAAPLVLLAWRSRLIPVRIVFRAKSVDATPPAARPPAPPLPSSTPDWDSVLHSPTSTSWASSAGSAMFGRAGRGRDSASDDSARVERAPAAAPTVAAPLPPKAVVTAPAAVAATPMVAARAPMVAAPAPMVPTPSPKVVTPPPVVSAPAPTVAVQKPKVAATRPVAASPALADEAAPTAQEPVLRVPFDRIADQLPPDVFTLPPARLAESLPEPNVLHIPRRLVLPQLGEGAVEIPWTLIDGQFPALAFAMPQAEVRRRFPGWVLSLPMDEVVRQLPLDLFRMEGQSADLSGIAEFPEPFSAGPPEPEEAPAPPTAVVKPAPAQTAVPALAAKQRESRPAEASEARAPARIAEIHASKPAMLDEADFEIPDVLFAPAASAPAPSIPAAPSAPAVVAAPVAPTPAAPVAPVPTVVPVTSAAPIVAPAPVTAPAPPVSRAPVVVATPPVSPAPVTPTEPMRLAPAAPASSPDDESEVLGRALALGLAPLGAFDWQARRVGGRPLVCFVPPALTREAIDTLVARAAPLVERLASWGIEQVTVRTTRLVCVLTPLGARGCMAAVLRRGGAVAMLERMSARAARATGEVASALSAAVFPEVAMAPITGGNGRHGLEDAVRALSAFGPIASAVADAEGTAPRVYVFADHDHAALAGVVRAVYGTLVAGHDHDALGRLESVVLRRGRECTIVRPLRGDAGPAVLAASGEVALTGRAHRAAAQAAALLEAR